MTSSWFFLSTPNYDARSTTHQMFRQCLCHIHGILKIKRLKGWVSCFTAKNGEGRVLHITNRPTSEGQGIATTEITNAQRLQAPIYLLRFPTKCYTILVRKSIRPDRP